MRFKDFKGLDGIDKLLECAPSVDEIFGDKEIFKEDVGSFGEVAIPVYKRHTDAVNKIFEVLEIKPENSTAIIKEVVMILSDILGNSETASFFSAASENLRSWLSHMANTEGEQSKDSSTT